MRAFYGEVRRSVRGVAADIDGVLAGVAGWYPVGARVYVFSTVTPELKARPLFLARAARDVLASLPADGVCVADPKEPGSRRFLEWLGWRHAGSTRDGEAYEWRR